MARFSEYSPDLLPYFSADGVLYLVFFFQDWKSSQPHEACYIRDEFNEVKRRDEFDIMIENAKSSSDVAPLLLFLVFSKIVQRRKFRNRTVFDLKSTHIALSTEFFDRLPNSSCSLPTSSGILLKLHFPDSFFLYLLPS